jgi:hypothetical protein
MWSILYISNLKYQVLEYSVEELGDAAYCVMCNDLLTHGCIGTVQSSHNSCSLFLNSTGRSNHCKNSCLISSLWADLIKTIRGFRALRVNRNLPNFADLRDTISLRDFHLLVPLPRVYFFFLEFHVLHHFHTAGVHLSIAHQKSKALVARMLKCWCLFLFFMAHSIDRLSMWVCSLHFLLGDGVFCVGGKIEDAGPGTFWGAGDLDGDWVSLWWIS